MCERRAGGGGGQSPPAGQVEAAVPPFQVADYVRSQIRQWAKTEPAEERVRSALAAILAREDWDGDGAISHREFSGPKHEEL